MLKVLKYMINKRNLPIVLMVLAGGVFVAFRTLGIGGTPPTKYERILHSVGEYLANVHYSPKPIDDKFSGEVFKKYLKEVDAEKDIFLRADVENLSSRYSTKIDDEILGSTSIQFVPAVTEVYRKRLAETEAIYKDILSHPFDFTKDEDFNQNYDELKFPTNDAERREGWRKRLKYLTLERYADLLEQQESNKSKPGFTVRTNEELEKDARARSLKVMDRIYDRLKVKETDDDRFNMFVQCIVQSMDPHTDYFPPVEKRYFDEQMSGHFFGIGASLSYDDGNIKISSLVTGSPAWKSGKVGVGDIIQKVAQGAQEPVDMSGYFTEDAIKIIRGQKGTEVRLWLKKPDGTVQMVTLIRDEIVQDELTFARSAIVSSPKGKIGYIYLPEFYADFDNPKGSRCSIDVAKEIFKLKEQKVDGIVLDLRDNGGGSLYDVVQMAGYFVEQGPIVQVRDRDGKPSIIPDHDKTVLYDGPFAVMVNELSASASEIFAAAIQDYHRGMINGGSTQLRGVASDIVLPDIYPDIYEYSKIQEKFNPDALPWDEIPKADYNTWKYAYDVNNIRGLSNERLRNNTSFNQIRQDEEWLSSIQDKVYPLSLKKFQDEQKKVKETVKQLQTLSKLSTGNELNVAALPQDAHKYDEDKNKGDRFQAWLKDKKTDLWLGEAVNVVDDMIAQKNLVYNK
jgi:carboxyl-terminal processing protease